MGYGVKDKYIVEDLLQPGVVLEDNVGIIQLNNYDEYVTIHNALSLLTRKFPDHEIIIRKTK